MRDCHPRPVERKASITVWIQAQRNRSLSRWLLRTAYPWGHVWVTLPYRFHAGKEGIGERRRLDCIPIFSDNVFRFAFFHKIFSLFCLPGASLSGGFSRFFLCRLAHERVCLLLLQGIKSCSKIADRICATRVQVLPLQENVLRRRFPPTFPHLLKLCRIWWFSNYFSVSSILALFQGNTVKGCWDNSCSPGLPHPLCSGFYI